MIQVATDGKSASQIEAEIRQRLAAAGVPDASVSVTDEAGHRNVKLKVERHADHPGAEMPGDVTLQLTKDGEALGGRGARVREKMLRSEAGTPLHFDVAASGRTASFDIANPESMSDAALAAAVDAQLRQAGLVLRVTVSAGKDSFEP